VPSEEVQALAELLNEKNLLDIDRIKVSIQELRNLYCKKQGHIIPENEFLAILEGLESIEVRMVDDGEQTDVYFIHE
jgi:hypothetical protein